MALSLRTLECQPAERLARSRQFGRLRPFDDLGVDDVAVEKKAVRHHTCEGRVQQAQHRAAAGAVEVRPQFRSGRCLGFADQGDQRPRAGRTRAPLAVIAARPAPARSVRVPLDGRRFSVA